jgi:hypothetical protein
VPIVLPSSLSDQDRTVDIAQLLRVEPTEALLRGAVIHEWLSRIEWLQEGKKNRGLPTRAALMRRARTVAPRASDGWLEQWWHEFEAMLERPAVAEALRRPRSSGRGERLEVWVERDFAMLKGHEMRRGRFDRVVVFQRSGRFVGAELIDWKTQSRAGFDAEAQERAIQQLLVYRESLASILGLLVPAVHASIVLLGSGERLEI